MQRMLDVFSLALANAITWCYATLDGFSFALAHVLEAMLAANFSGRIGFTWHHHRSYRNRWSLETFHRVSRIARIAKRTPQFGNWRWENHTLRNLRRLTARTLGAMWEKTGGICKSDKRPKFLGFWSCSEMQSALKAMHPIQAFFLTSKLSLTTLVWQTWQRTLQFHCNKFMKHIFPETGMIKNKRS